jgi:ribose-phosphate pyrophosphokinase
MGELKIFSGNANLPLADEICAHVGVECGKAVVDKFRNGETKIKIQEHVRGSDVFVIQSLSHPSNDHIMEMLIMIDALKRASAGRITAVIPYYAYAKQEKKTRGREPISAKLVANMIVTAGTDRVLAVDLHAPAIQGFFDIPVDHLSAIPLLAMKLEDDYLLDEIVVVSPDSGGVTRAEDFRVRIKAGLALIAKKRPEPDQVEVLDMVGDVEGKVAVIVDDMISTGGTLVEAANELINRGARSVLAYAVHPVLAGGACETIRLSPLERVVVTNTIQVPAEDRDPKIHIESVAKLVGEAIHRIHEGKSVSELFEAPRFLQRELLI